MSTETQKVDVLKVMEDCIATQREVELVTGGQFGSPKAVADITEARDAVAELIDAAKDEALRSSATSLPLKAELAKELGITVCEVDSWMLHTRRRFLSAVARIGGAA